MAPFPFPGLNELRDKYRYAYFSQFTTDVCTAAANLKKKVVISEMVGTRNFLSVLRANLVIFFYVNLVTRNDCILHLLLVVYHIDLFI
jgi:hypothetical protein